MLAIAVAQFMVALDTTIVNVALPHIQRSLGFSGSGLEWVVNAYAVTFGGVLLLGGRAGDLLGRRRAFAAGLLLFSAASLAGGLASSQAWLLAARAVQGTGAAITAPAALALIATTFPEGRARDRAVGVYSAANAVGGTIGLLAGGLLSTYASWPWVLYVNVPIGVAIALASPLVLAEAPRQHGRFGLPSALAGAGGVAALVYGLCAAAASPDGTSHWSDGKVIASLTAAAVLLAAFGRMQSRSRQPLLPARLLRDGDRCGAYLIMLCAATAMSAVFFFLTVFQEEAWGYSPLRTGVGYLPMTAAVLAASGASARLVTRVAARPLLLAGAAVATGGLYWLSRLSEHGSYAETVLGPTVVVGCGLGLLSVPLSLTALARVGDSDSGVASSLLSVGQQVGGAVGLAVLGTAAWTVAADSARTELAGAAPMAGHHGESGGQWRAAIYQHALATGFGSALLAAAGIMLVALAIAVTRIHAPRGTSARVGPRHRRRARLDAVEAPVKACHDNTPRHSRSPARRRGSSRLRSRARHRRGRTGSPRPATPGSRAAPS